MENPDPKEKPTDTPNSKWDGPMQESDLKTNPIFSKIKLYECADVMSGKVN